jgi:uracil-DNA glycosylase
MLVPADLVPKRLGDPRERERRRALLTVPHITALTDFVRRLRAARGLRDEVPFFDPLDGGVTASCLFVLEAPGPNAVASGFVSRDNPDETAKNLLSLCAEAGIPRSRTAIWNIVPWYIGSGTKIRAAQRADIAEGLPHLLKLVRMLNNLRAIVLLGQKPHVIGPELARQCPNVRLFKSPHPSPLYVNNKPGNRAIILERFREVAQSMGAGVE